MSQGNSYWISPSGEIHNVNINNIDFVCQNLEIFEMSLEEYHSYFHKFEVPYGLEGNARSEMFINLLKRGWIRIGENSKTGWTIELWYLTFETYNNLTEWSKLDIIKDSAIGIDQVEIHIIKEIEEAENQFKKLIEQEKSAIESKVRLNISYLNKSEEGNNIHLIPKTIANYLESHIIKTTIQNIRNGQFIQKYFYS